MSQTRRPWVRDAKTAQWGGLALLVAGSLLIYDAYEGHGRPRPWWTRLAPGP